MKPYKANLIYAIIFLGIFIALSPVIFSNNYLRQDDLMWDIWPGMKISQFGYLYYNTVFQLVRPICMISFYITDLLSIDIYKAIYIRLFSISLLGIMGLMLYKWQTYFNSNKILAATFAITSFTLPAYQVFAATGNYSLILTALLLTFNAVFLWFHAFKVNHPNKRKWYKRIGYILFFLSLLDYPLSSMYAWFLIFIQYINTRFKKNKLEDNLCIKQMSTTIISLMLFYYLFSRIFHKIFKVHLEGNRVAVIDTSGLFKRFYKVIEALNWHSDLWFWRGLKPLLDSNIWWIIFLYAFALLYSHRNMQEQKTEFRSLLKVFSVTGLLFFLAYSPILATSEVMITFRYTLVTMPMLLYIVMWSLTSLSQLNFRFHQLRHVFGTCVSVLFIAITIFSISYTNIMLADGIVGPHDHDFTFIQNELRNKVLPLIKANKKVLIHAIACDGQNITFAPGIPTQFEYGMRVCQYQQQVIGVIIHSLNKFGYPSNFKKNNEVIYNENEIVVKDTPWGTLVVNSVENTNQFLRNQYQIQNIVTIDMRSASIYQKHELYKKLVTNFLTNHIT